MKKTRSLLFAFILLAGWTHAQTPFFQNYFLLKKNEPVQVNKMFQARNGFLWFGTNKGLFRFDGEDYVRYTRTDSLPDNDVTALAEDSVGNLWVGLRNGKIAILKEGIIDRFEPREGSATEPISDILFDSKGILWFSTLNDGLYYFINDRLYRLDEQEGMPDLFVYDIQEDHQGNILAGTDGGLVQCKLDGTTPRLTVLNQQRGLPDNIVKKILLSGDGFIWLATEDAGIIRFDPVAQRFESLFPGGWTFGSVSDFIMKGNKFWISGASGLIVYDQKQKSYNSYNQKSSTAISSIHTLLKDGEGNIWAGSKSGVTRTPGDYLEFFTTNGMESNTLAIAEDNAGCIWFSNYDGLFRQCGNGTAQVSRNVLANTPYQGFTVISLYADRRGSVWAGLYGEGLLEINAANGKILRLYNKELRNGNVLSITGKDETIWLATLGGAAAINTATGKRSITSYFTDNGLSSDFIYQVFIDSNDRAWFATDGKGVDMLDETGFHHFQDGAVNVVYGFAEDSNNEIWANVQGSGLYKFTNGKFLAVDSATRFRDTNIAAFAADEVGNIVVINDLGIDLYNIHTGKVRYLGEEAGVQNMRANLNSLARDTQGRFLIGTEGGAIRIASAESTIQYSPKITIESVDIFGRPLAASSLGSLDYDENSLTINFLGFWYQDPTTLKFLYKTDNYDADWISTRDNSVTYSQLPPGDYTFRVKASETDDFSNAREDSISFTIRPPFWRTNLFYLLAGVTVLFSGYSFLMYRERQLIREKAELEAKVEERTREIQRKTEEIQAQNEEIMAQAEEIKGINENLESMVKQRTAELEKKNLALEEYAFINAHKLRSPVASILGLVNLLSKTKLDPEAKEINTHLEQSAEELDKIVSSITKAIERGDKTI
jgi:ligand-binding sensor domain-containing protein